MSKMNRPQRYIFKINSKRLKRHKWCLNLEMDEAEKNEELVMVGESEILRMIDSIRNGENTASKRYFEIKDEIDELKRLPTNKANKRKISKLNDKLKKILFVKDYVMIVFNTKADYKVAARKGVSINGEIFKRLYGTTVGIKKNTIIFVSEDIHSELYGRTENNRNPNVKIVPAKYEAYKSLASSVSSPLRYVKPEEILVVHDHVTKFESSATEVKPCIGDKPTIVNIEKIEMELEASDGNGIVRQDLSREFARDLGEDYIPTGFCIRNAFCKGMIYTFPMNEFVRKIAMDRHGKSPVVKDVWGNDVDVRKVKLVLTTSMLKLWNCYDGIQHYIECCNRNGFQFSATKITPKELENERYMTYQFLQSLYLNESQIKELIQPTIDELKDVLGGDYRKSILYLRGKNMNEDNVDLFDFDFVQALMIDKRMINDPFVRYRIHRMIKKAIDEAKFGVVKVRGNYTPIASDIYGLAESIFGIEVDGKIGKGLLNPGEFYSNYWNQLRVNKVVAMRAPMCTHANIRILNIKNNKEVRHWFRYMPNCTVFNSWDSTCESLSGADKDGDSIITTDNKIIISGVRELPPLICKLDNVEKTIVTDKLIEKSNLNGFNNNVGSVTNKATSIRNKMSLFDEGSPEYIELEKREMAVQRIQQSVIDSIKTGKSERMPKTWYNYSVNKIITHEMADKNKDLVADNEETIKHKEFNLKILADKKPYFMIYIYSGLKRQYEEYIENCNIHSLRRFGLSLNNLLNKQNKNKSEKLFVEWYYKKMPIDISPSLMNIICWKIEEEFDGVLDDVTSDIDFDYTILKSDRGYNMKNFNEVKKVFKQYKRDVQSFVVNNSTKRSDRNERRKKRWMFLNRFKTEAIKKCNNLEELCNIVVDMCYKSECNKQFAWDVAGEQIIKNLLQKNNGKITYFEKDINGDVEFSGDKFILKTKDVNKGEFNGCGIE